MKKLKRTDILSLMIKYLYFVVPVHTLHAIYCGPYKIMSKMNKLNYLFFPISISSHINNQHILLRIIPYSPFNRYGPQYIACKVWTGTTKYKYFIIRLKISVLFNFFIPYFFFIFLFKYLAHFSNYSVPFF
jgi:hypothetical protein